MRFTIAMQTTIVVAVASGPITAGAASEGPCDITGAAGNPCVAAHSTVRALYSSFNGSLYKLLRMSDMQHANVGVLEPGGFANIATHDAFCPQLDCVISNIYDQSPQGNHLYQRHGLVNASQHKIIVGNNISVYGALFGVLHFIPCYLLPPVHTCALCSGVHDQS